MTTYETQMALTPNTTLEKVLAAVAHGSLLLGIPIMLPLCTLLFATFVQSSPYVKQQSLQALVFHFVSTFIFVAFMVTAGLFGFFGVVGAALMSGQSGQELVLPANWGIAFLFAIAGLLFMAWASIMGLIATVKAFQGKPYRYPITGGLI